MFRWLCAVKSFSLSPVQKRTLPHPKLSKKRFEKNLTNVNPLFYPEDLCKWASAGWQQTSVFASVSVWQTFQHSTRASAVYIHDSLLQSQVSVKHQTLRDRGHIKEVNKQPDTPEKHLHWVDNANQREMPPEPPNTKPPNCWEVLLIVKTSSYIWEDEIFCRMRPRPWQAGSGTNPGPADGAWF